MKNAIMKKSEIKSIKNYLVLAIILASSFSYSQGAIQFGYTNLVQSTPYFGIDYRVDEHDPMGWVNIGTGAYLYKNENGTEIIPEIHTNATLLIVMFDVSLITKAFNPGIGVGIFNGVKLKFGYNYAFDSSHFKGTTVGLFFNIGGDGYYSSKNLKFMP